MAKRKATATVAAVETWEGDRGADGPAAGRKVVETIHEDGEDRPVLRRAGSRALALLPLSRREAARRYADAVERVAAPGGVNLLGSGGGARGESRQFHAVEAASWLARLDREVGAGVVRLDARGRVVARGRLLRLVAVDGRSLSDVCRRFGLEATAHRRAALGAALIDDLGKLARLMGLE